MKIYNEALDETITSGILQNGLNYYIIPKSGYAEKRALLTIKYGSVDSVFRADGKTYETDLGCAHFLEHKLFDSEGGSAFESFSRLGSYVNAYTSFNNTAYYFSCENNFKQNLETLLGFVSEPHFTEESVKKELPIIAQEISMYDDNPGWASYFDMLSNLYEEHPAKNNIAGNSESIAKITAKTLYKCYESFYVPENMYLICSGGFDTDEASKVTEIAEKYMKGGGNRAETLVLPEGGSVKSKKSIRQMNVSRPIFQLGFKDTEFTEQVRRACIFKITLDLLIGESSALRDKLVKERIVDETPSFDYVCGNGYGYAVISGESSSPEKLLEACAGKALEISSRGFDEKDFLRIKKKHLGRFTRGFNSVEAITAAAAENAVKGASLFDCYENYANAEIDDCNSLLSGLFRDGGFALSVLEP